MKENKEAVRKHTTICNSHVFSGGLISKCSKKKRKKKKIPKTTLFQPGVLFRVRSARSARLGSGRVGWSARAGGRVCCVRARRVIIGARGNCGVATHSHALTRARTWGIHQKHVASHLYVPVRRLPWNGFAFSPRYSRPAFTGKWSGPGVPSDSKVENGQFVINRLCVHSELSSYRSSTCLEVMWPVLLM